MSIKYERKRAFMNYFEFRTFGARFFFSELIFDSPFFFQNRFLQLYKHCLGCKHWNGYPLELKWLKKVYFNTFHGWWHDLDRSIISKIEKISKKKKYSVTELSKPNDSKNSLLTTFCNWMWPCEPVFLMKTNKIKSISEKNWYILFSMPSSWWA